MGQFWMHKWSIFIILDTLQEFLKLLHNEMGQYIDKNNISFSQKKLVWGKYTFLTQTWPILIALDWL